MTTKSEILKSQPVPKFESSAQKSHAPRTKPGQRGLFVNVSDAHHELLTKSADGRPVNIWLSKLVERHIEEWTEIVG
ncbi:MAG: hypothetical protein WCA89_10605 [Terracidiphilus sp.]|jgi:hypothetical protein